MLLLPTLLLNGPADARKWFKFDGTVVISDEQVPNAVLVPDDFVPPTPEQLRKLRPQRNPSSYPTSGRVAIPEDRDVLGFLLEAVKYTPPKSRWLESEKALYAQLLSQARADVLVAPVQVRGAAFDQPERLLMAARLARYIEESSGSRVADPFLVDRALGTGARELDQHDIERLAAALGAARIVVGFAGHDRAGHMDLTVRVLEMKGATIDYQRTPVEKRWAGLSFETETPADVLARLLPEIVQQLGIGGRQPAQPRPFPAAGPLSMPKSPEAITRVSQDSSPVVRAYHLQLLGALYPWYSERARDRAFVRSLMVLDEVQPDSPDYRLLKARALFGLQRRPYALRALGEPRTPEERALKAALNGNLPDLQKEVPQIKSPLKKFLAQLDLTELRARYGALDRDVGRPELMAMLNGSPDWQALMLWKVRDWDHWTQRSNLELKAMLDRSLPAPGPTAESLLRGQAALNEFDPRNAELELSVFQHTHKLFGAKGADWCCQSAFAIPNRWDHLDLLADLAETNLTYQVEFYLDTRGQPERAAEVLARYEGVYKDHPAFASLRGWTDWKLSALRQGPERDSLRQQSIDSAMRALYWGQGQTWAAWDGMHLAREESRQNAAPTPADAKIWNALSDGIIGDWPFRWYWATWEQGGNGQLMARNTSERLAYTNHNFGAVTDLLYFLDATGAKKLLAETADRFVGSPDRVAFLAQNGDALPDAASKKRVYQDAIRANPAAWAPYQQLGVLAIEEGNYAEAAKTYRSYPGFSPESKQDRVGLSQYANDAGSRLYWRGAIDEAIPLMQLSAGYGTGSSGSMMSSAQLKLLDGDYRGAAEGELERAQRYNDPYAYRDFLALLHVTGYSRDAWPAFDAVMEKFENPEVWASAFVGKRISGAKDKDVEQWLLSDHIKSAMAGETRFAPSLAVLWYAVDRKPGPGFVSLVERLDSPSRYFVAEGQYARTMRGDPAANPEGSGLPLVGPSDYKAEGRPKRAAGTIVRPFVVYFAEAYTLLRDDDYAGANRIFEEMAGHYFFGGTYAIAYFARAAAKSGNGDQLESYLDGKTAPANQTQFDYQLAKAFFAGAKGKHDEAVQHLKDAFNTRPSTEWRPVFTDYQFVEACEWLYRDSKNKAYRDLALNWARKYQRIAPMFSWAYAIEAELTDSAEDRRRALGITLYLDPNSERAAKFSAAERNKAKAWLKANNPFLKPPGKREDA